uniref:Evolutionarily conserved signaling intermediate in Toll pathway, mitochondrial n=1 Tax=Mytilus galloprovincialis TaxID=29158 RepID=W5XMC3_MYTGA|nr:ECSIT [Mytilus galloprovincialis]
MLKITEPMQCIARLVIKRQKLLSSLYHSSVPSCKENKDIISTDKENIQIIKKETDTGLMRPKFEASQDIQSPPPPEEDQPNPRDRKNKIDMRFIPKKYTKTPQAIQFTKKSALIFDSLESKPKTLQTFKTACNIYLDKEGLYRRGHVEFIYAARDKLKEYNLNYDLNAYKALMNVFPKERLKPRSKIEAEFRRYPKQQDCAIEVLDTMGKNGVIPDVQFYNLILSVFGEYSHVTRKLQRTMYWLPKFKHANPWPIPKLLPDNKIELAKLALKRMAFDINNELTVWKTTETEENPNEDTFIVSAQSAKQRELIKKLSPDKAVFVDGGYNVYLRNVMQTYFVLRADPEPEPEVKVDEEEDLFNWTTIFEEEKPSSIVLKKSVHEQEDGVILGMCITGSSTRDSLVSWIRYLQDSNPNLEHIPVVFTLKTVGQGTDVVKYDQQNQKQSSAS